MLVEYGDFECSHCGHVEPVIRDLLARFDRELVFVFRHLPLDDIHPHALQAALAAEAAAEQGCFWPMHDVLFSRQSALERNDIVGYATDLGLDVDRFTADMERRRLAARVRRDFDSADASGAAGTPTFFINGQRHDAAPTADALAEAITRDLRERRRPSTAVT